MVPQVADWVMAEMLVDVESSIDMETRPKRAKRVHCPECGAGYERMSWKPTKEPDVPALVCSCGAVFPLSTSRDHSSSASSSSTE